MGFGAPEKPLRAGGRVAAAKLTTRDSFTEGRVRKPELYQSQSSYRNKTTKYADTHCAGT